MNFFNMFKGAKKNVIIEDDIMIENDKEEECKVLPPKKMKKKKLDVEVVIAYQDDIDYELISKKLEKPVYEFNETQGLIKDKGYNKKGYVLDIKDLKHMNLYPYRHQRECNNTHVNSLKEGIKKTGYLYHPIIVCHIPSRKEYSIIDGQHRFNALKEITKEDVEYNIKVQIDVIDINEDDDSMVMDVYRNVNTCEPINMKQIVLEQDYVKFIQKLKNVFGKKVIVENKRKMKHYIIETDLKNEFMKRELLVKYSFDVLLTRIIEINNELKEKMILLNKLTDSEKERCAKTDFWLSTDFPNWLNKL